MAALEAYNEGGWGMANAQPVSPATAAGEELDLEIDDSADTTRQGDQAQSSPIVVLSRDLALADTVRKAAPRGVQVLQANDLDQIAAKLPALQPGVLVIDMASTADAAALVAQLTQHFPELVVVIAGKREDSSALMQLTAAGRVFRFLLTPLTHGQTRLALEAATTQHRDLKAAGQRQSTADSGDSTDGRNYLVTYGALAAGLLLAIGAIWFGIKQFSGQPAAVVAEAPGNTAPMPGVPEKPDPIKAELAAARQALAQDKLLEPSGESALDYFRSALALDPNSQEAKNGIRAVADKLLARAETALTAEHLEDAVRNIEYVRDIDASHPRLAFLDTQIVRERERLKLTEARDVSNRVRKLVDQAADRLSDGRLIAPANGNARDALLEARRLDPTDPMVAQTIRDLSARLTDEAGKSLAAGKVDEARAYANSARQLGSAGSALSQVERALANNARSAADAPAANVNATNANAASQSSAQPGATTPGASNVDALIATTRQRLADGKLIEPAGESARDALSRLSTAAPNRPEVEELSRVLTTRLVNSAKQAGAAKSLDRAAQLLAAARAVGARYDEPFVAQAEAELAALREQGKEQDWVSAGELKRIRMVDPVYPDTARKRGIEGWVELAFVVTVDGSVENVEVRNSTPGKTFDEAAIRAVRQWRFEPVERNGQKVPQRALVRLRFIQPR